MTKISNAFFIICVSLLTIVTTANTIAQSPVGMWKTIDDETGEAKSQVQIYEQNGKLYGKVIKLLRKGVDPNKKCTACSGTLKDKPIVGMVILNNISVYKDYWKNGTILDPEKGKEYNCSIWFENKNYDQLYLRGYLGPFFRTQKWYRVK